MKCAGCLVGSLLIGAIIGLFVGIMGIAISNELVLATESLVCEDNESMTTEEDLFESQNRVGVDGLGSPYSYYCVQDDNTRKVTTTAFIYYFAIVGVLPAIPVWLLGMLWGGIVSSSSEPSSLGANFQLPIVESPTSSVILRLDDGQVTISAKWWGEIQRFATSGNKVQAIKLLRQESGLGLKQSKEIVEAIQRAGKDNVI